nr:uncharacterized protein LOC127348387 [Lolium perenne]
MPAHTDDPTSPACPRFHGEQRPIPNRDGVEASAESGGVSSMGNNKPTLRRHHVYVNDNARGNATAWEQPGSTRSSDDGCATDPHMYDEMSDMYYFVYDFVWSTNSIQFSSFI